MCVGNHGDFLAQQFRTDCCLCSSFQEAVTDPGAALSMGRTAIDVCQGRRLVHTEHDSTSCGLKALRAFVFLCG